MSDSAKRRRISINERLHAALTARRAPARVPLASECSVRFHLLAQPRLESMDWRRPPGWEFPECVALSEAPVCRTGPRLPSSSARA